MITDAILIITALGLLICALALTVLSRQIGLISRRMVQLGKGGKAPGLETGTEIPVREFALADGSGKLDLRDGGQQPTILLFASLACALCRSLLESLRELNPDILDATVLMLLDSGPWKRFSGELEELGLDSLRVVLAVDYAEAFEITMPPQVYVVGGDLRIMDAGRVFTAEEFAKIAGKHIDLVNDEIVADNRKENRLEKQTLI